MLKKTINFDTFKLVTIDRENNEIPFESCLEKSSKKYRSFTDRSGPVELVGKIVSENGFFMGTMSHNQMIDLPPVQDMETGEVSQLDLKETQGLGHYSSFLFDPHLQFIIYESKMTGVTLNAFCRFFELNYNLPEIQTEFVLDPQDIERMSRMDTIKKFHVKIAKNETGDIFGSKKVGFGQIIDSADDTNSNELEYTIKASRLRDSSLNRTKITNFVRAFSKHIQTEEVTKLEVTGREIEDNASRVIDFVANRVRIKIQVEKQRFSSSFALEEKYTMMQREYNLIRSRLLKGYRRKPSK